ncbi:kelch-like protein 26 [Glandiceps talaboti]
MSATKDPAITYTTTILQNLRQLRNENLLNDVTLVADGQYMDCHRIVLAACSDFFKAMFTTGMKECNQSVIQLKGVSATGLQVVLESMYSGEIDLDLEHLDEVIATASYLQVLPVIDVIKSSITLTSCVCVYQFSKLYELQGLERASFVFIRQNLGNSEVQKRIKNLEYTDIHKLLQDNQIEGCTETELYQIASSWLNVDETRREFARELLSVIRFPLMNPDDILKLNKTDLENWGCLSFLEEATTYQTQTYNVHECQSPRTKLRSTNQRLVLLGGCTRPYPMAKVLAYRGRDQVTQLQDMHKGVCYHGTTVMDNFLYSVGGRDATYKVSKRTCRYDPVRDEWLELDKTNVPRSDFWLGNVRGKLYAVGGRNGDSHTDTVECYVPSENRWKLVASLPDPLIGHTGCAYDGCLYISGGITPRKGFMNSILRYEPRTDMWTEFSSMSCPRAFHSMCNLGNKLYVIGGCNKTSNLKSVECICPTEKSWTRVSSLTHAHRKTLATVVDGRILVVGGYTSSNSEITGIIAEYNTATDTWTEIDQLRLTLEGVAGCSMLLPNCEVGNMRHNSKL